MAFDLILHSFFRTLQSSIATLILGLAAFFAITMSEPASSDDTAPVPRPYSIGWRTFETLETAINWIKEQAGPLAPHVRPADGKAFPYQVPDRGQVRFVYEFQYEDVPYEQARPTWYNMGSCLVEECQSEQQAIDQRVDYLNQQAYCVDRVEAINDWTYSGLSSRWGNGVHMSFSREYNIHSFRRDGHGNCTQTQYVDYHIMYKLKPVECPEGYGFVYTGKEPPYFICKPSQHGIKVLYKPELQTPFICTGNPCDTATGAKLHSEHVYRSADLAFSIHYNSRSNLSEQNTFAHHWTHNYSSAIVGGRALKWLRRPDGGYLSFHSTGYAGRYGINGHLDLELRQTENGFELYSTDGRVESYSSDGALLSIQRPRQPDLSFTYDENRRLEKVISESGRQLTLSYGKDGELTRLAIPGGRAIVFSYDDDPKLFRKRLSSIHYPDGSVRRFLHEDAEHWLALTGIIDESGDRYATYQYDKHGRLTQSVHAGGADKMQYQYAWPDKTTFTDASGRSVEISFSTTAFGRMPAALSSPCGDHCSFDYRAVEYDRYGRPRTAVDHNGNTRRHSWPNYNFRHVETVAAGTKDERTIITERHTDSFRLSRKSLPGRLIEYTYDASGNRLTETVTDTETGESRTTAWTYNTLGLVATVDGPRTDASDVTTYTYDAFGNLATVTNALGHVTRYTRYDAHGNPLEIVDPNGIVTELEYDLRQRLVRRTVAAGIASEATTTFDYDLVGQLVRTTLPNGAWIAYEYDAAHRMTAIEDSTGNRIDYVLDAMGNRVEELVSGADGRVFRETFREYNQLNRLVTESGPEGSRRDFEYDAEGNVTSVTDAQGDSTTSRYDALDRLLETVDALGGVTSYDYDPRDNLTRVVDPRGVTTDYVYNGFNELLETRSPDAGTTKYTYDAAGNRISQTDARGIMVEYQYDALNRLTFIDYPGTERDITYVYDEGSNAIGRLARVDDESGRTEYVYGSRGNLVHKLSVVDSEAGEQYLPLDYGHDVADNLTSISYPSGNLVQYQRDGHGRITGLTITRADGTEVNLATDIRYVPFGPAKALTFGNGITDTRTFDREGRISRIASPVLDYVYNWDTTGNITGKTDNLDSSRTQTFGYDDLYRLTDATGLYGALSYTYDAVGNRTRKTDNGLDTVYGYAMDSNRLLNISGADGTASYTYDANGNTLNNGEHSYAYDARNRFIEVDGQYRYTHNALGQRVVKPRFLTAAPGEASGDGVIDQNDLLVLRDILSNRSPETPGADCNQDGVVDNKDTSCIANQIGSMKNKGKGQENRSNLGADSSPQTSTTTIFASINEGPGDIVGQILFMYDEAGHLLGEYDEFGNVIREYVWLDDRPLAMIADGNVYFIHSDHLNTPQAVTDENQSVVWKADYQPFGEVTETISTIEMPLRFAGQYHDEESGLHYNYFRSYDPQTGRYGQNDPIGIDGGLNLYGYANQNPLRYVDPFGLNPGFSCFQAMLTGETSFADCYTEEGIKKPLEQTITETAQAAECGLKCSATCTVKFVVGEVRDKAIAASAKQAAKRMANELAKKWLLRGIPIVGTASTAFAGKDALECTYKCWAN